MNVLHINSYLKRSSFYIDLYKSLGKLGCNSDIYVFLSNKEKMLHEQKIENMILDRCFCSWERYLFYIKHIKVYKSFRKKYNNLDNINCIHAHSLFSNGYLAYRLKKEIGIPYVVAVRSTDIVDFFGHIYFLRKLGIEILLNASKIIYISNTYKKVLLETYIPQKYRAEVEEKSIVIPNGLSDFWLRHIGNPRVYKGEKIRISYIGQIKKRKNIIDLCKAVTQLNEDGLKVQLTIAGKVIDNELMKKINKCKYAKYIGELNNVQMIDLYKETDILAMVSRYETFGLVYIEAMSQGVPIVYTEKEGFDGFYPPGVVGYPARCGDIDSIKVAIRKIIYNYNDISNNCIRYTEDFSWDRIAKQYLTIYEEIEDKKY